jgi:phospholipid/cholesterol/gamma-HCH transport system substrate-binding protein
MERNANYTLVGFASLAIMIALVTFVIWLGRLSLAKEYDLYEIAFQGPISGLTEGGEVRFNGIKVGEVSKLALDEKDPSKVIARARLTAKVPIRIDSFATLEPLGITGVNYVQISAGTPTQPLLKDVTPSGQIPLIKSKNGALSDLLQGGGTVLARAVEALDRVNKVLSDKNVAAFSSTISDISVVTAEIKDKKEMFADAQNALQSIDATAKSIKDLANSSQTLVNVDGKNAFASISSAADELKAAAADARTTLNAVKGPAGDFSNNTLPQIQQTIVSLQSTAESLDRLVNEIEQSPQQLLRKEPSKEVQVKP